MRKIDLTRLKTTESVPSGFLSLLSSNFSYANSTANGLVRLVDSTSNTDATIAASANSVKVTYDVATGAAAGAVANGAAAYANAVIYTNTLAATAYSNAVTQAAALADTAFANAAGRAADAYTNAIAYAASNTYVNTQLGLKASLDGASFTGAVSIANSANVSGSLQVGGILTVAGNLVINGTTTTVNTSSINVTDSLLYLASNNEVSDSLDIGFAAHYNAGSGANGHTGLIRSAVTKKYYLFQNYQPEFYANNTVDVSNTATGIEMADLVVGNLVANSTLSAGNTTITGTLNTSGLLTANVITVSNVSATQQNLQVDAAGTATAMAIVFGG